MITSGRVPRIQRTDRPSRSSARRAATTEHRSLDDGGRPEVATQTEERTALSTWVPISQALELQARAARADRSVSAELRRALNRYLTSGPKDTGAEARGLDPGVDPCDGPTGANEAISPAASGSGRPILPSTDNPEEPL